MSAEDPDKKIIIDEDWKSRVQAEKQAAAAQAAEQQTAPDAQHEQGPLPPASFTGLVSMLATQALVALGQAVYPGAPRPEVRPDEARHFIDLLAMLQDKTKGNLADTETKLLENVLHELRMGFVYATQHPQAPPIDPAAGAGSPIVTP